MRSFLLQMSWTLVRAVFAVAGRVIVDFDFHVSTEYIYWLDFSSRYYQDRRLGVHRIKLNGTGYAQLVSISAGSNVRNNSALAINWVEGTSCQYH